MQENVKLVGTLQIHKNGVLIREVPNLIVDAGKNWVATTLQAGTGTPMSHMAVGTGVTAPAAGDTTLETELARVALSVSGGTVTGGSTQYVGVFPAGTGTGSLTEAGIFNDVSVGTMLNRATFTAVPKGALDQITITWTVNQV